MVKIGVNLLEFLEQEIQVGKQFSAGEGAVTEAVLGGSGEGAQDQEQEDGDGFRHGKECKM